MFNLIEGNILSDPVITITIAIKVIAVTGRESP
jgi:hypothetical protein